MNNPDNTFGGRIEPKKEKKVDWANLVDLDNEGIAFVYKRLSSHEQVKKHLYSIQAQDSLVELAKDAGYKDDQIHVEERDLGISGTKGYEEREGLAYLIDCIQQGLVESVFVVHLSRLYRDQTLIDALSFGELCKEHSVIIVTPQMRLNLNDKMHMRLYRMEVERAADELLLMRARMGGALELKARQGRYVGAGIPPGYILDTDKTIEVDGKVVDNPNYYKYKVYEPHAEIVRWLFKLAQIPGMTVPKMLRRCDEEGIAFPPFPEELALIKPNLVSFARSKRKEDRSWIITLSRVRSILRNPAYIGWWIWKKELIKKNNHPTIIDDETFFTVQKLFGKQPHRPRREFPQLALSGLIYCEDHDVPRRLIASNAKEGKYKYALYQCRDVRDCSAHVTIRARFLEEPISEAVVSRCSYPDLAEDVLQQLQAEYEEAKAVTTSHSRELKRLEKEVENLEYNFCNVRLTPDRAAKLEAQIQERLSRIEELSKMDSTDIGQLIGSTIAQEDVNAVKKFLSNLSEGWSRQPSDLKNAFFRLVLEQVTIWPSPSDILVRITWRTGQEDHIVIHKPYREPARKWTEEEVILREHYLAMPYEQLMSLLPNRTWRQIRSKGYSLGLKREINDRKAGGGRPYKPWEDEVIKRHYRGEINMLEAMAELDERTEESVRSRMKAIGLKRDFSKRLEWEWVEPNFLTKEGKPGREVRKSS